MHEYVEVRMRIEKIFDGSAMTYEVLDQSCKLSEKFKKILMEDYDVEVEEYSALVVDNEIFEHLSGD